MIAIQQIRQPVLAQFEQFQKEYLKRIQGNLPVLQEVSSYLTQYQGKQLRPLLVLLSAKACGTLKPQHILVATVMELLHNSTLMHDDVVDESDTRRGHAAVRKQWGNQAAVLCGDYLLSQTMKTLYDIHDDQVTDIINSTVSIMCEGELKQLAFNNQTLDQNNYLDIIGCKTASLMSACCELGAYPMDGSDTSNYRKAMHDFGYNYGIVFQINDDNHDSNILHDATPNLHVDTQQLIKHHTQLAFDALQAIPHSPARQSLLDLLSPLAPQPTNQ